MTLVAKKHKLISQISALKNEADVARLEVVFKNLTTGDELLQKLAKPLRKRLDLDELVWDQGYKGGDRQKFDAIFKLLDIVNHETKSAQKHNHFG